MPAKAASSTHLSPPRSAGKPPRATDTSIGEAGKDAVDIGHCRGAESVANGCMLS